MATKKKAAVLGAAVAVIVVPFTVDFEGLRLKAYLDPIKVPTACVGETDGIRLGMTFTREQCMDMLRERLGEFYAGAAACVPSLPTMPPARQAAVTSLAYNIGTGAFCKSSVARLLNAGYVQAGCDAFMKWTKAGGVTFKGLVRRREAERALCLRDA